MVGDELQNIDWAGEMRFISYGVRVGVRVNDKSILDSLPKHLPPLLKPTTAPVDKLYSIVLRERVNRRRMRLHRLFEDDRQIMQMDDVAALLNYFETVVQLHVADYAPRRVFVHAGVVSWQGKAIVIPGRSFSGKTSLVVEFLRAGATYYSDEYAVLDHRGLVHPYPRLLSVREAGAVVGNKRRVEELGGRAGKMPLPIGLILATKYREGAHFRPRQLSPGEAILAMFDNTVSARRQPTTALATIKQAIAEAQLWKGTRGETAETVAMVLKKFTM